MNAQWRRLSVSLLVLAVLQLPAAIASAQPDPAQVDPTHYWTYRMLEPVAQPSPLFVHDQFFREGVPVTVDSLVRLVNWVHKNGSAVRDTFLHYTWWNVIEKYPMPRTVDVLNQFGLYPVSVHNVEFLLAPALKNEPQPAFPPANHYLCYRATGFPGPNRPFSLADEWRQDFQIPYSMEYLCLPCVKEHHGLVYVPPDTLTHLALYPILPHSEYFAPFVMDQFMAGPRYVQQSPPEYLMVPSLKFEQPTPTERSSWGRIKSIYR